MYCKGILINAGSYKAEFYAELRCEKTHNDWFAERLSSQGISLDSFGWASVQADGGIEATATHEHVQRIPKISIDIV